MFSPTHDFMIKKTLIKGKFPHFLDEILTNWSELISVSLHITEIQ